MRHAARRIMFVASPCILAVVLACAPVHSPLVPRAASEPVPFATPAEWDAFCEQLKHVGREVFREDLPSTPRDRAEAHRYLLQRLSASIAEVLEAATEPPVVALYSHKLRKYGMDSADAKYSVVRIDPTGSYRLYGTLGSAHHIALQFVTNHEGYEAFDSLGLTALRDQAGPEFEVQLSRERPADWIGPWLRLDPRARELIIREYFYDWEAETTSRFMIERLDESKRPSRLEAVAMKGLLDEIASTFAATVPKWFAPTLDDRANRVNRLRPPARGPREGLHDNAYGSGWFRLGRDEALLIELEEPDAHLWSFELGDVWWQSIDYVNHTSSLNGYQAVRSSDGRYRLVVSLEDPGVPNWLDPAGHEEGAIIYRYQLAAEEKPVPTARLVERSELRELLPADTPVVTPAQRQAERELRRTHAARRWAP